MILTPKKVILYKPQKACWVAEAKMVKQVTTQYANTIELNAYTTKSEAEAKAATNVVAVGKVELIP